MLRLDSHIIYSIDRDDVFCYIIPIIQSSEEYELVIKQETLVDKVVDRILEAAKNGDFIIGKKLPIHEELQTMFGVSRNTIREALQRLESIGVVTIRQGNGTYLNDINIKRSLDKLTPILKLNNTDLSSLIVARKTLEVQTAQDAALCATEEDIREFEYYLNEMKACTNDVQKYTQLDMKFHLAVARSSGNAILYKFFEVISDLMHAQQEAVINSSTMVEVSRHYHTGLIEAIKARDPNKAASIMAEHIDNVYHRLSDGIE